MMLSYLQNTLFSSCTYVIMPRLILSSNSRSLRRDVIYGRPHKMIKSRTQLCVTFEKLMKYSNFWTSQEVIGKFGSTLEETKRKERTKLKFRMFQKIVTTFKTIRLRIRIVNRFNSIINIQLVILKKK